MTTAKCSCGNTLDDPNFKSCARCRNYARAYKQRKRLEAKGIVPHHIQAQHDRAMATLGNFKAALNAVAGVTQDT